MQKMLAAAALLLAAAGCSVGDTPPRHVEERPFAGPAPRGDTLLRSAMMRGHAAARGEVGLAPLRWDDMLARDALSYAREMAQTRRFQHSAEPRGPAPQGENLWTGTRDAYRYDEMVGHWVAEKRDYVHAPTPAFSRTGRWQDVSHYTQIVSRRTTTFGCAVASSARDDYLVCRYTLPGNLVGERVY